uniref:Odorant receptor n=1 Tax=Yemma signatus TaxID=300820 RepID=A0A385H531_9HEMI|nr:odorant receptor [Yemma signatus]
MWDFRQLRWLNIMGWWPSACKTTFGYRISRVIGLTFYISNIIQLGFELVNLFQQISIGSLKGTILNLTTTLMGILTTLKVFVILVYAKDIQDTIAKFEEIENKVRKVLPKEIVEEINVRNTFFSKWGSNVANLMMVFTTHWLVRPLIFLTQGERVLIIETWVPFGLEQDLRGWWVAWLVQTTHIFTAMYGFFMFDSIGYSFLESLHMVIEYLKESLSRLDFSAPGVDHHSPLTLRFCVELHKEIIRQKEKLNSLFGHNILIQTISSTFVFCLSVFELSSIEGTTLVKIMNLVELILIIGYSTFLYSYLCQQVADENVRVMQAAYANNWYRGNEKDKQSLFLLIEAWKKELKFGYIVQSNLQTFIATLKSSFTYFNFLQAISEGELVSS